MIESMPYIKNKLRSKRFRHPRSKISPILFSENKNSRSYSVVSIDSSNCSYIGDDVCSNFKKRQFGEVSGTNETNKKIQDDVQFRRVTRSYSKQQKQNESNGNEVDGSESSCVLSNSLVTFRERSSKFKKGGKNVKKIEPKEISRSGILPVEQISVCDNTVKLSAGNWKTSSATKEKNDVVSNSSGVESCSVATPNENRALEILELSDISKHDAVDSDLDISNSESVVEQKLRSSKFDSDLACTEQFSYDDVSECSSSHKNALSEQQYEIFLENSDLGFSDYTPSIFLESGSEFSVQSMDDTSTPSPSYSLFQDYSKQFYRSTIPLEGRKCSLVQEETQYRFKVVRFEDEDDEVSYQRFRERERRQKFLLDYAEEYLSTTDYGDLIRQQRSQMVRWIVEQCNAKELQPESLFLGVSLLDRFLTRGFFTTKRTLQIVGIASLTLATKIEENQPHNSVRQENFNIEDNIYSRCEVVAMEWLVQEVLNFQCFLPTIYNFLWFYLKAAKVDAEVERKAKYLAVLALSDHEHLCYWPSTVAATLVILACAESHQDKSYQRVTEIHVRTEDNDLPHCIKSLERLVHYAS